MVTREVNILKAPLVVAAIVCACTDHLWAAFILLMVATFVEFKVRWSKY